MRLAQWMLAVGALLFVFGIGFVVVGARSARQAPAATTAPAVPVATVKQLMNGLIDPAATKVWDSVSTNISDRGVEEVFPKSDAEWAAVGDSAAALAEAGTLLMMEGRAIDRGEWATIATAMIEASRHALRAVDAKSTDGILEAGGELFTACDTCHKQYQRQ